MAKVIALLVWLGIIQTMKIQLVWLVQWDFIQTKVFKLPIILVNNAHRVRIPRPKVYPVLTDATIVPRANIQPSKVVPTKMIVKIVQQIHLVLNKEGTNRVTRVKKDQHRQKVQRFLPPVKQENICIPPRESHIVKIVLRDK